MFENPRRGRQARNFYYNGSENSRSQIVFRTDIFRKLTLGAAEVEPFSFFSSTTVKIIRWLLKSVRDREQKKLCNMLVSIF